MWEYKFRVLQNKSPLKKLQMLEEAYGRMVTMLRGSTTAWHVIGLRMEERPPVMEGSCKYIE
jgi:hypothetical protein